MKVSELIDILRKCPQDLEAVLAYDHMACVASVEPWDIAVVPEETERWDAAVYLCCSSAALDWYIGDGDHDKINDACDNPMPGYRPDGCYAEHLTSPGID